MDTSKSSQGQGVEEVERSGKKQRSSSPTEVGPSILKPVSVEEYLSLVYPKPRPRAAARPPTAFLQQRQFSPGGYQASGYPTAQRSMAQGRYPGPYGQNTKRPPNLGRSPQSMQQAVGPRMTMSPGAYGQMLAAQPNKRSRLPQTRRSQSEQYPYIQKMTAGHGQATQGVYAEHPAFRPRTQGYSGASGRVAPRMPPHPTGRRQTRQQAPFGQRQAKPF